MCSSCRSAYGRADLQSGASLITAKAAESWVDTLKVANGDFETGDSSNWTIESGSGAELVVKNGGSNVNSTYYLNIWASDAADVSITPDCRGCSCRNIQARV